VGLGLCRLGNEYWYEWVWDCVFELTQELDKRVKGVNPNRGLTRIALLSCSCVLWICWMQDIYIYIYIYIHIYIYIYK